MSQQDTKGREPGIFDSGSGYVGFGVLDFLGFGSRLLSFGSWCWGLQPPSSEGHWLSSLGFRA